MQSGEKHRQHKVDTKNIPQCTMSCLDRSALSLCFLSSFPL